MNIGLFTDTYYPELNGVANSVFLLKQELEKKGHNVYVVTTKSPEAGETEKGVFRVPSRAWEPVPERRIGMIYSPKIARQIHKMKLDIIHTNTEFSVGMFGRIMAHELLIPVVHTYHTIYEDYTHYLKKYISSDKRARQFAKQFSKFSVRGAEELIVPTEKVAQLMRLYGVKPPINVIPTGIELDRYRPQDGEAKKRKLRAALGIPERSKVVLSLGRVSEEKNIDEVMEYLDRYMDRHPDVTFLIVGDGPYRSTLEKKSRGLKHRKQMIFAGAKPWDEIGHYYQLANVFVSASTSETQGLTYIEALASGVPVLVREDPCLEGVLEHGKNGFGFEQEESFFAGLDQLLYGGRDVEFRSNALATAERFSTEQFANRVENIYYHVTMTHRGRLMKMADKIVDKISHENAGVKKLGGQMAMELGASGMDASRIALGCMRLGEVSEQDASRLVSSALESGITLFDHADIYGDGRSEEIFGKVLSANKGMRERMRIQTKCGIRDGYYDLSKAHILSSVEDSLRRLQVDYLDLFLLHRPDALMEPEEIAETFDQLAKSGKVRQFGVSNFHSAQIELLQAACDQKLIVDQLQFGLMHASMLRQGLEANTDLDGAVQRDLAVLDYCRLNRITVQAWSPLQYGMFQGSFLGSPQFPELNALLEELAGRYDVAPAAIAVAWILRHPAGIQVMAGTTSPEHLAELCRAVEIRLTRTEWYALYRAAGYPVP